MSIGHFDDFAEDYVDIHRKNLKITGESPEFFYRYKVTTLKNELGDFVPKKILDFGAGVGNSTKYFIEEFPNADIYLTDISEESLLKAEQRYGKSANYLLIEKDVIPENIKDFDLIFSAGVFHHLTLESQKYWLNYLKGLLSTKGEMFIFEHNPYNPVTRLLVKNCPFDEGVTLVKSRNLEKLVSAAGYSQIKKKYRLFFPSFLAFFRPLEKHLSWLPLGAQYFISVKK